MPISLPASYDCYEGSNGATLQLTLPLQYTIAHGQVKLPSPGLGRDDDQRPRVACGAASEWPLGWRGQGCTDSFFFGDSFPEWKRVPVDVDGGGRSFWQIEYVLLKDECVNFHVHGES